MTGPALTEEGIGVVLDALEADARELDAVLDAMQGRVARLAYAARLAASGWDEAALRQLKVAVA